MTKQVQKQHLTDPVYTQKLLLLNYYHS